MAYIAARSAFSLTEPPVRTLDTVLFETPAYLATSNIDTLILFSPFGIVPKFIVPILFQNVNTKSYIFINFQPSYLSLPLKTPASGN